MNLRHYSVSQVRLAAMCPRVHYFDAEWSRRFELKKRRISMLWRGNGVPVGGAMFHHAIERFNKRAATAPAIVGSFREHETPALIHEAMARFFATEVFDRTLLSDAPVEVQKGFIDAVHAYLGQLANIVAAGRRAGVSAEGLVDQLFGDFRKSVDVTFEGLGDVRVRVTGTIDYVFFDWRDRCTRIFDYKLTPCHLPHGDVVQVATYALMHDRQHATRPATAVFYLHPEVRLVEHSWDDVWEQRSKIYDRIASMAAWEDYDERTGRGLKPPGEPSLCEHCPWRRSCVERLGDKSDGQMASLHDAGVEPRIDVVDGVHAGPELDEVEPSSEDSQYPGDARSEVGRGRLWLGFEEDGRAMTVSVGTLNTHVAVVGAAGSGKTWTAKIIAEEAARNGVPVIAIDPQGDLVQFLVRSDPTKLTGDLRAAHEEFARGTAVRVFTPGTSHATRLCLNPIKLPRPEDLQGLTPQRQKEEEESMIQAVASNLVGLASSAGDRLSQETFLYQVLLEMPRATAVNIDDIVERIRNPDLFGVDEPDALIKKTDREKLAMRLNAYVKGPAASLFTGGVPLDVASMISPTTAGKTPINVIYLNALANDDQKQFFVASLATEIYRWMVTSGSAGAATSVLFYIDEARDYVPAGSTQPPAKQPLLRLFAQGRKYGVACLLCTQSPRSVDYNAFGNCSSKLIGRLESAQDVERVRDWFTAGGSAPEWIDARKGAEKGTFVARWAGGADGRLFRGRPLFSAHEGAWSPHQLEEMVGKSD